MSVSVLLDRPCLDPAHRLPLHRRLSLRPRQMEVTGKVHRQVMEVMVRVHLRGMVMAVEADTDKHDKFRIIKIPHCLIGRVEAIFFVCVQRVSRSRGMIPRSFLMIFYA